MAANGIDFQVISHVAPAAQGLPGAEGVARAREANDLLAGAVAAHPGKFAGFATLPTADPDAAADELERATGELGLIGAMINSTLGSNGLFLDDARFEPLLARFERLDVPLYLHPAPPRRRCTMCCTAACRLPWRAACRPARGAGMPSSACTCCG
jgi:predicted TIM-barrel fold metal-dependent hydrolase